MTGDDVGEPVPSKKEKKARAHPRTRRRLRRPDAAVNSGGANVQATAGDSQNTRWVIVSRSSSSAARRGKPPLGQLRVDRMATPSEGGTDNGQHRGCAAISQNEPASPLTPRQDLLPVSLLSPATSSDTPGTRRARPCTPSTYSPARYIPQHGAHKGKGANGKHGEDLPQKGRSRMPNRWVPRRGRGSGEERGTRSGQGLQVFDMSPRLSSATGRTGAFNPGGGVADGPVLAMVTPPRRDGDADESSQGLWAKMGATSAFWLDLPAQVNPTPDQEYVPEGGAVWKRPLHEGEDLLSDENELEVAERRRWQEWARHAAEHERQRRIQILEGMDREEHRERMVRRAWALSAMDEEQRRRASQQFLLSIEGTNWFQGTISSVDLDYEIVCPYSSLGCRHICLRTELDKHLAKDCRFNKEPEDSDFETLVDASEYEVVCPNTILGCDHSCSRSSLTQHLETCRFTGPDVKEEEAERARSLQMVLQQAEEERARRVAHDAKGDWQSDSLALKTRQFLHRLLEDQMKTALVILHKEILECAARCRQIQARRKQELEDIWRRLESVIGLLWPGASVLQYGSYASGMMTPDSDVDLVVFPMGGREERTTNFYRRDDKSNPSTPVTANSPGETKSTEGVPRTKAHTGLSPVPGLDADHFSLSPSPSQVEAETARGAKGQQSRRCDTSSPKATVDGTNDNASRNGSWARRRGGSRMGGGVLSRIHDLADHLRNNAPFIEVVKVLHHARVPIIKAVASSDGGSESGDNFRVNIDISVDGPTHTGLATSAFVSYLADHLPNLVPLTIVLKSLLQSKGLNDPYTGGLSSYGLVLMVAFALLRRDHFPPSPSGMPSGPSFADADFIQRSTPDRTTPSQRRATPPPPDRETEDSPSQRQATPPPPDRETEERGGGEQPEETCSTTVSPRSRSVSENRSDAKDYDFSVPPSPGHSDGFPAPILQFSPASKVEVEESSSKNSVARSVGRQRGFWQRPSLTSLTRGGDGWTGMLARDARAGNRTVKRQTSRGDGQNMSSWDRPRQQYWVGSRTARAVLMQEFHAGAPTPAPTTLESDQQSSSEVRGGSCVASEPRGDGGIPISSVPPPPPPPLPQPVADFCLHPMMPPLSPYITSGEEPVLGELLLDFLHLFGEDFDMAREGFSVRGGGFRFCVHDHPPHPQAGDPIVIEDPLNCMNNVGRGSFGIGQVQRAFFEALTTLKAKMVRVNQDGKEVLGSDGGSTKTNTGILRHICSPYAASNAAAARNPASNGGAGNPASNDCAGKPASNG